MPASAGVVNLSCLNNFIILHHDVDVDFILDYSEIPSYALDDPAYWGTQSQVNRFNNAAVEATEEGDLFRKVGRYTVETRFWAPGKKYITV